MEGKEQTTSDNIFDLTAKLREHYPDDAERIEADEDRAKKILQHKDLASHEGVKEILSNLREEIINAKMRLAETRVIDEELRDELWIIIESRKWILSVLAVDFDSELEQIEADLKTELDRSIA